MGAGGCTWQWLQRTVQQPMGQSSFVAPSVSQSQDASHDHAHHILSQHTKHTRRLLRLFRRALSRQTSVTLRGSSAIHGSELPAQMPAAAARVCNPTREELASRHIASSSAAVSKGAPAVSCQSATAAAAALDPAAAQASPALRGAASAAVTDSTADHTMSASTQAGDTKAADNHSPSAPHSASNKAALFSQTMPSTQTTILVEAILPDQQLCANLCHTPCLVNFSVAPQTLASHSGGKLQSDASTTEGINTQRELAEKLVRQHMQSREFCWNNSAPIQLSSSIKVSYL